jgi:hypothetical protein
MLEKKITVLSYKTTLRIVLSALHDCPICHHYFFGSLAVAQGKFPGQKTKNDPGVGGNNLEPAWSLL